MEKTSSSSNPKAFEMHRGSNELLSDLSALFSVQDHRAIYHCPHQTFGQPSAPAGTGGFSARKFTVDQVTLLTQNI